MAAKKNEKVDIREGTTARRLIATCIGVFCVGVAGCTTASPAGSPAGTTPPISTPASAPGAPSPSPLPAGDLRWTVPAPSHAYLIPMQDGYLLVQGMGPYDVYSLGRDGTQRWHKTYGRAPGSDYHSDVQAAGSVVAMWQTNPARSEWPGSQIMQVLDARSGRVLWRDDRPSFITVTATAIYTSVCHGGQNNRIGDCRLSARDPRTGRTRWTIPTYASSRVETADPRGNLTPSPAAPYLVVVSYPTGFASQTVTTIDPKTGRPLGASVRTIGYAQTEHALLAIDSAHNEAEQGCKTTLRALNPRGGRTLWRRTVAGFLHSDGQCSQVDRHAIADGQLATVDSRGRTTLISLANGKTTWTASKPGKPVLVGRGFVLTASAEDGLSYHDRATNTVRWRKRGFDAASGGEIEWRAVVIGTWLAVYDRNGSPRCLRQCVRSVEILDPVSGTPRRSPPGAFVAAGNGMVVTETEVEHSSGPLVSDYRAYAVA